MRVGYARTSDLDQNIQGQLDLLAGCDKVFHEKRRGSDRTRPELAACLEFVRQGDTLVCTRIDRMARSVSHLCEIVEILERKGVELKILSGPVDTTSAHGKLLFHILAALAEFELCLRAERQREGLDAAKLAGVKLGPERKLSTQEALDLRRERGEGYSIKRLARMYGVSPRTVYRYLGMDNEAGTASVRPPRTGMGAAPAVGDPVRD